MYLTIRIFGILIIVVLVSCRAGTSRMHSDTSSADPIVAKPSSTTGAKEGSKTEINIRLDVRARPGEGVADCGTPTMVEVAVLEIGYPDGRMETMELGYAGDAETGGCEPCNLENKELPPEGALASIFCEWGEVTENWAVLIEEGKLVLLRYYADEDPADSSWEHYKPFEPIVLPAGVNVAANKMPMCR